MNVNSPSPPVCKFAECDDFMLQFALASDIGRQLSDAWFAARQVIDSANASLNRMIPKTAAQPRCRTQSRNTLLQTQFERKKYARLL